MEQSNTIKVSRLYEQLLCACIDIMQQYIAKVNTNMQCKYVCFYEQNITIILLSHVFPLLILYVLLPIY